jgi:hypothetical protein
MSRVGGVDPHPERVGSPGRPVKDPLGVFGGHVDTAAAGAKTKTIVPVGAVQANGTIKIHVGRAKLVAAFTACVR